MKDDFRSWKRQCETYPNSSQLSILKSLARNQSVALSVVSQDTFHVNVESVFKLNGLIVENKDTLTGTSETGEGMLRIIEQGVSPSLDACTRVLTGPCTHNQEHMYT